MARLSNTVQKSLLLLQALLEVEGKVYSKLIQDKQLQNAITEVAHNLLENHLSIAQKHRQKLKREESVLRLLATKGAEKSKPKVKKVLKLLLKATLPILKRHGGSD